MAGDSETSQKLPTVANESNQDVAKSRKRKRPFVDTLSTAYSSVSFVPRVLNGECRPDSPHFFFSSSYTVKHSDIESEKKGAGCNSNDETEVEISQVVHQHVNGLCMVTVGDLSIPQSKILKSIRFIAQEAPPCSNAEKRKRQAKMLKGKGKVDHIVTPSTVIAELVLEERTSTQETMDGDDPNPKTTIIPIRACVWGTILEINDANLTPEVLLKDPLLDGL